jgi:hypothetical protein
MLLWELRELSARNAEQDSPLPDVHLPNERQRQGEQTLALFGLESNEEMARLVGVGGEERAFHEARDTVASESDVPVRVGERKNRDLHASRLSVDREEVAGVP